MDVEAVPGVPDEAPITADATAATASISAQQPASGSYLVGLPEELQKEIFSHVSSLLHSLPSPATAMPSKANKCNHSCSVPSAI